MFSTNRLARSLFLRRLGGVIAFSQYTVHPAQKGSGSYTSISLVTMFTPRLTVEGVKQFILFLGHLDLKTEDGVLWIVPIDEPL